jgi:hypothetical protein
VWNRIPDDVREQIVDLALDEPELSPRELATRFTDTKKYFVSEASAYRLLKAQHPIHLELSDDGHDVAGHRATGQVTSDRRRCPSHDGRAAMLEIPSRTPQARTQRRE